MATSGFLSTIKNHLVPAGQQVRSIRGGLLKGLKAPIDLRTGMQVQYGLWERETHCWMRQFSYDVATFIDVGASRGLITLYALAKTHAPKVLAIEPEEGCRAALQQLIEMNDINATGRLDVFGAFVGGQNDGPVRTLDSLALAVAEPIVIKVDVDGHEMEVLRGAQGILTERQVRLIVETHTAELERQCVRFLEEFGYQVFIIKNAWWRFLVPERRTSQHNRWLIAYRSSV